MNEKQALHEVMEWIDNWDPDFTNEEDWTELDKKIREMMRDETILKEVFSWNMPNWLGHQLVRWLDKWFTVPWRGRWDAYLSIQCRDGYEKPWSILLGKME